MCVMWKVRPAAVWCAPASGWAVSLLVRYVVLFLLGFGFNLPGEWGLASTPEGLLGPAGFKLDICLALVAFWSSTSSAPLRSLDSFACCSSRVRQFVLVAPRVC